jgi:hypothetical protein
LHFNNKPAIEIVGAVHIDNGVSRRLSFGNQLACFVLNAYGSMTFLERQHAVYKAYTQTFVFA